MTRRTARPSAAVFALADLEDELSRSGCARLAGVDEAGRGPLAGPVVAAAVILPQGWQDPGVADSKLLSPKRREELNPLIQATAADWAIGVCSAEEVDRFNIHRASLLAMRRAVEGLRGTPDFILVDGSFTIELDIPQRAVVKGDSRCRCIAAASILAKVWRDAVMLELHQKYPAYNFAGNKGYATAEHKRALASHGPCPAHRFSYTPVAQMSLGWTHE